MKTTTAMLIGLICCGTCAAQDPIAKEMTERQLKTIRETPSEQPVILRLDQDLEELLKRAKQLPDAQRVQFIADGLSPQQKMYAVFGMPQLNEFAKFLLGKAQYPKVRLSRDSFADRDLSAEIQAAYRKCSDAYGKPLDKAPLYKVAFGYQHATNAQMQGTDDRIGRNIVVLNRSALVPSRYWDAAIIHETWHCFQSFKGTTLLENAVFEGVVTELTQVVDPTLQDHEIMLWRKSEWDAAMERRDAIVQAFAKHRDSTDPKIKRNYMILGRKLTAVPGAPSRSGYFVALLAVRAWRRENPDRGPAGLIAAKAEDIWQAFSSELEP